MIIEIKIPTPGESITEVEISNWFVADGDLVKKDQEVAEIESAKATLPLVAPEAGRIKILAPANETVQVGMVACTIDTDAAPAQATPTPSPAPAKAVEKAPIVETKAAPIVVEEEKKLSEELKNVKVSPLAQKLMDEKGLSLEEVIEGIRRITKEDVELISSLPTAAAAPSAPVVTAPSAPSRERESTKMTQLRKMLSQRLVAVKNETAMLTTFNEIDMSEVMALRNKYKDKFNQKHGVRLGFMSFFTKAVSEALKVYPVIGAMIDGDQVITSKYADIAIAVQAPKGLMVPVIRNAESLSLAQIESAIVALADKARNNKLSMEEMTGGTFTITNGGTFGSLLSTPIINPPQSAILGMHNIVDRPVAVKGKVEIRPMMYVALSYDHRIIDGSSSVGFLVKVKELIENPTKLLFGGNDPEKLLLGL